MNTLSDAYLNIRQKIDESEQPTITPSQFVDAQSDNSLESLVDLQKWVMGKIQMDFPSPVEREFLNSVFKEIEKRKLKIMRNKKVII